MQLRDIAKPESKFFLKSVYGPLGPGWPAMSFTHPQLKTYLNQHYRPERDFILFAGTLGKDTNTEYRGLLLSVMIIDLSKSYRTEAIVPEESWRWAQEHYPGQWQYSFGILKGWNFVIPPRSINLLPRSYRLMGQYPYRSRVKQIEPDERELILNLDVAEVPLPVRPAMRPTLTLQALQRNRELNTEAVRIASLIHQRVDASGSIATRTVPERTAPPKSDLVLMVAELLLEVPLSCTLCGGLMLIHPGNKLLQPSPDRIDSASGSYGPENFQLSHLACNLAKSNATVAQFEEWLSIASIRPSDHELGSDFD